MPTSRLTPPQREAPLISSFETAFAHAPIGMALVDMADRVLRVNDALCRITGYTAAEIGARSFRDLGDPHDADLDAPQIVDLLTGHKQQYEIEKRFRHAWGHLVWVLMSVSLVRDDQGRSCHFIVQLQDISERKELEGHLDH